MKDWKSLDPKLLNDYNGRRLQEAPFLDILERHFPEYSWNQISRYPHRAPHPDQRIYLDRWVSACLAHVATHDLLLQIDYKLFSRLPGGATILTFHNGSPRAVFHHAYPECPARSVKGSYDGAGKQRLFIDDFIVRFFSGVSKQAHLTEMTNKQLLEFPGGHRIMFLHGNSPQSFFSHVYPELVPRYRTVSHGFWKDSEKTALMHNLIKAFKLRRMSDWCRLSLEQCSMVFGNHVHKKNMVQLLERWYPEEGAWGLRLFEKARKRAKQKFLGLKLVELFKNEVLFEDFVVKDGLRTYVFDFYMPNRKLVIEYQGEQHYYSVLKWVPLEQQQIRDKEKKAICDNNHIQLVEIPYWWDWTLLSLSQIISSHLENAPSDSYPLNECYQLPH
eukprot:TRINITY_DN13419_c0_g3_i1.p1 TRINITY_DN13419_c0_g3~~TRINITY_DN13419_c0_g3_i1.p1  ORF type:complete len:411 (-),score=50.74 TRINITY_DN13419_c0_g3_i1:290-1453(-)